eukprot:NODE_6548_length_498_cov_0.753950.p1 GENE.NODE_6548_length_498_cov_0.753950~~NODE_6548_length_498_cov_0.753950.p1  ORF type:complete len:95 (+),score=5.70 NODE_6548_length_498_cov_0.753950:167-451(+)
MVIRRSYRIAHPGASFSFACVHALAPGRVKPGLRLMVSSYMPFRSVKGYLRPEARCLIPLPLWLKVTSKPAFTACATLYRGFATLHTCAVMVAT